MNVQKVVRLTIVGLWLSLMSSYGQSSSSENKIRIVSYNVENLFDTQHDSLREDYSFLPNGDHHWTYNRYKKKVRDIARVIVNIGEWDTPAIVGMCEVENERCIRDLLYIGGLKNMGYKYIHYESEDVRGVDCAMLYDAKQFSLLYSAAWRITMPEGERKTRDLLYAKGLVNKTDTLHVIMCHLPSQLGGKATTQHKRDAAIHCLQTHIDSIMQTDMNAHIVVMGDMNSSPQQNIRGMRNMMIDIEGRGEGTYKWQGEWSCLDQFYMSLRLSEHAQIQIYKTDWLLEEDEKYTGKRPFRTYIGMRYKGGYSDHLPIVADILFR